MSAIELNQVSLDYIMKTGSNSLKKTALQLCRGLVKKTHTPYVNSVKNTAYRALHNINLHIASGDRIGLLGRNGAGKTTLLRVMGKIYTPTSGYMRIDGKISSLFELGLGLDPESTGYENIVHLAIMRGFSKKMAVSIIPDVEEFTELGNFLHAPVRTYSTGMQIKLVFAVATAIQAEIILIDEVIGAGDAHFMQKATNRISNVIKNSHILVLTSHSNEIIRKFCQKVVVLDGGEIQFIGEVEEGINFYDTKIAK